MHIEFEVPGVPVAKGRPRATRRKKKDGSEFLAMVTPDATVEFESRVRSCFGSAAGELGWPTDLPVRLSVRAVWPMRGSPRKRDPRPAQVKVTRPDIDNVAKAVLDGLNGVAYLDDAQVCDLHASKAHAAQGMPPMVRVRLETLEEVR